MRICALLRLAVPMVSALAAPVAAQGLKLADSFRVGTGGVLCTAQSVVNDGVLVGMFDRGYTIVCRDAATPVGKLFVLRAGGVDPALRLLTARKDDISCASPAIVTIPGMTGVTRAECRSGALAYAVYLHRVGNSVYAAEGLAGYGSALRLGLRSLVADTVVPGDVEVAATEAGDPAAFARVQAGSLDPGQALAEGYSRNNAANYAESAAFFDTLAQRSREGSAGFDRTAEYLANQALQQSNLGNFAEADALFARAESAADPADPQMFRMLRNYRGMHALNRGDADAALVQLRRTRIESDPGQDRERLRGGFIDVPIAQKLNSGDAALARLSGVDIRLTDAERIAIYNAQGQYLQGIVLRDQGHDGESRTALASAIAQLDRVRNGRVLSVAWLKAAAFAELSALAERGGRATEALKALEQAVLLLQAEYPESAALLAAKARLAALLARQGNVDAAQALFREVVRASPATPGAGPAVRMLFAPYFALLVDRATAASPSAAADFFDASQILARPGVAQTQAVLARELSGGHDAAAGLFRQSITLSRDIVRSEVDIARLAAKPSLTTDEAADLVGARASRERLGRDQTAILARLSEYPRFRVLSNASVGLADLQGRLRPGEAYYKLVLIGDAAYGLLVSADRAQVFRVGATGAAIGTMVASLRDTIVTIENGRPATYPFDAVTARKLYLALFGPVDGTMASVHHLIFEPDGALLQLPVNLLIASDDGMAAYAARLADTNADAFDMRGIVWLGRDRIVSTAVSPRSFLDNRAIPASKAPRSYLGLGQNAPPSAAVAKAPRDTCDWPLFNWNNPIQPAELRIGAAMVGGGTADVVTGAAFTDTGLAARGDLDRFRILHFATHGLVTAPRPECPARPALLTSFGHATSDGLLSFREIFDLKLDADTVILSACDTAGTATAAATREAGIATGGNYALDGLVRAFVGAGARTVIASHWPVPDGYDATKTLITGLFADEGGISVGEALRVSEVRMMDRAETSHPYYWSGFAIIGDAAKPLSTR